MSNRKYLSQRITALMAAALLACVSIAGPASAQGHLRLGMTANDVPLTWGQPDNGFEGYRTPALMIYDSLVNFDLTTPDKPSGLIPGLAESWEPGRRLPTIPGNPSDLANLPPGCPFAPRCNLAGGRCYEINPGPTQLGPEHYARCLKVTA